MIDYPGEKNEVGFPARDCLQFPLVKLMLLKLDDKSISYLTCSLKIYGLLAKSEVKMAGYWPGSLGVFLDRDRGP